MENISIFDFILNDDFMAFIVLLGKFMQDIEKDYRERVTANKKMRYKIKDLKMQLLEAEKELASMKSNSSH